MFFVLGEEEEEEWGERGDHKGGRRVRPLLSNSKKRVDPERVLRIPSVARQGEPGQRTAQNLSGSRARGCKASSSSSELSGSVEGSPHLGDCSTASPRKATHRTVREPLPGDKRGDKGCEGREGCLRHKFVHAAGRAGRLPGTKMGSRPKIEIGPEVKIGIDPAKHTSMVMAIDKNGKKLFHRVLSHDRKGMELLVEQVERLHTETGAEIEILIEASSHFWQTTYQSLSQAKAQRHWSWAVVCIVSSKATAMSRKTQQREVGSDGRDAYLIADMGYGHTVSKTMPTEEELSDLRRLCRLHTELTQDLTRKKNQLRSSLDCVNPAYSKVFRKTSLYTKGSLALLEGYVLPEEFQSEDLGTLAEIYNKAAKKKSGEKRIKLLLDGIANSVPIQYAKDAHAYLVRVRVEQIRSLLETRTSLENKIRTACEDWGEIEILSSLPGVSMIGAAKILGESGNPTRFKNGSAYVAWFGLDPKGKESAGYASQKKISKSGTPLGRHVWIQAAHIAIQRSPYFNRAAEKKWENLGRNTRIIELYRHDKNRRRIEAIKQKIVVCAVAAKMARTGFALLRDSRTYTEKNQ